jgi:hypothetical protein
LHGSHARLHRQERQSGLDQPNAPLRIALQREIGKLGNPSRIFFHLICASSFRAKWPVQAREFAG